MRLKATPHGLGLPYPGWHPEQVTALEWLLDTEDGPQVRFLDAPTATGKSGIAYALQKLSGQPVYVATWSRALQRQYHEDYGVPIIMGRSNFYCEPGDNHGGMESCEWGYCDDNDSVVHVCPYQQQLDEGIKADFSVLNYAVLLTYQGDKLPVRPWLVCDEGDMVEDAIGQHLDITLSREWFESVDFPIELPAHGNRETLWYWVRKVQEHYFSPVDAKRAVQWNRGRKAANELLLALEDRTRVIQDTGMNISVRVLWPLEQSGDLLLRYPNILIMSATLGDMDALAWQMKLHDDEYETLGVPSPIPEENRPVYVAPVANLSKKATPLDYEDMAYAIIELGRRSYPSEKGIIHVSSFEMSKRLGRLLQRGVPAQGLKDPLDGLGTRVIIQSRSNDVDAITLWQKTPAGILITPSAKRGVDFPYLFSWQVIAKLPYPDLSDAVVRARLAADPEWYLRVTARLTVQSAGRVARTPTDQGVTFLLDSSFEKNLWKRAKDSFPLWFQSALRWSRTIEEIT